ncbi:uncharacterized protein LOC131164535 isoform X2 [Malania oleifera]|uniref:uncharacterized protein LOC131164535 isoform X2 n=1 Tax=Malania oleifera TaxID=397392 RepID=UPI0025AE5C7E|nr:uncharacterized protein LOC131164535 isoform X2 [Malania oleifera]
MRMLPVYGGVHAGVHTEGSGEVPGEMDLRTVRGSREGRDREIEEAYQHGRSSESAHQLLQKVQLIHPASQSNSSSHLRHETASPAKLGFAQSLALDAGQSHEQRPGDSPAGAHSLGKLFPDAVWLIGRREEKKKEIKKKRYERKIIQTKK